MLWFIIAAIGYLMLAIVAVLDKIILAKKEGNPTLYTFYSTIFMLPLLVALPFGVRNLVGVDWFWGVGSGIAFGLGLWTMYAGVQKGEASRISPFIGAIVTITIYFLASTFANENLTRVQIIGLLILVAATILFSLEKRKDDTEFNVGFLWAIMAGIFFALSHVAAKHIYALYPFFTVLVWTKGSAGLVGVFLLLFPSVQASLKSNKKNPATKTKKKNYLFMVTSDKVLSVVGTLMIQYAIAIGSVTLVNAMAGLQYAFLFILAYGFTKLAPNFFRESFTKGKIFLETIAVILMLIGSALVVWR